MKECLKVSVVTIIVNFLLSLIKFLAGIFGKSSAMLSDSIHSLSDVLSTIIVIVGLKLSNKTSDDKHQYGHERFEDVASLVLSFLLLLTGLLLGYSGIKNLINNNFVVPSKLAIYAAIISIAVKEWMYHYTIRASKKYNSNSLKADAWHHRSDALSSVASLIGIVFCMLGYKYMDLVASLIISLVIVKVAIDIFIQSINKMIDKSCDDNTIDEIKYIVFGIDGVLDIELLKSRLFGNKVYIDLEISASKDLSFVESHEIAHEVHDKIEQKIKNVKHCMVHINPK